MTNEHQNLIVSLCSQSARLSMPLDENALWLICRETLHGNLPNEPDPEICVSQIKLRGYCEHNGLYWGLMFNSERKRIELVMFG